MANLPSDHDFERNERSDIYVPPINRGEGAAENGSYGVRYEPFGQDGSPSAGGTRKRRGGLIALILAGAVVLSALSGFGGALMMAGYISASAPSLDTGEPTGDRNNVVFDTTDKTGSTATIQRAPGGVVTVVDGKVGDEDLSVADVAALVSDCVVEITTETVVNGGFLGQYITSGAGSGVVVAPEGYIVTNNHVIEGATSILVRLRGGEEYKASLVGRDEESDLAVIKIESDKALTVAVLGNSADLVVGEEVVAIGNPLGELGGTVTDGIISALAREVKIDGEDMTLLQTNAAINPGNSGGGLFNRRGELIGVVNAKSSGEGIEGLGFAIPIDYAARIITTLIENGYIPGKVDHGLTLISQSVSGIFSSFGNVIYITESKFSDELKYGDRLVSIDGQLVSSISDARRAIEDRQIGDVVEVIVYRNNRQIAVKLTLGEYIP